MSMKWVGLLLLLALAGGLLLAACDSGPESTQPPAAQPAPTATEPPEPEPALAAATATPDGLLFFGKAGSDQVLRVDSVDGISVPVYPLANGLDLLIMGSREAADYGGFSFADFYDDVKPLIRDVFGGPNALQDGPYEAPFNYYVTDFEYAHATPAAVDECNAGLPGSWLPTPDPPAESVHLPAWNCNIALSTADVSLDLALILHIQRVQDSNRYNVFSSEFDSYAAVLHELSHAAFAMSDEADGPGGGHFSPSASPNVYLGDPTCGVAYPGVCTRIPNTAFYRYLPDDDTINLMFFDPPPTPGVNDGWDDYRYWFGSEDRLQYIYDACARGEC